MLKGKNVVLGITGGIAAYKSCEVVSRLIKLNANVDVIMTDAATRFVTPLTFETLSLNPVTVGMFEQKKTWEVGHISLAKKADLLAVVPATANIIAKATSGLADDMLSTTILATRAPLLFAPAMNTAMLTNPITQQNIALLKQKGARFVESATGRLACGDIGEGKLADVDDIMTAIIDRLFPDKRLLGKKIMVTAGATQEAVDGVRFLTNKSSGAMGFAIAKKAREMGAAVTLISGIHKGEIPFGVENIDVVTTQQMYEQVLDKCKDFDAVIKAAAPADYRVENYNVKKHKEERLTLTFVKNPDIAQAVGKIKGGTKLVVFAAETENLIENAKAKLISKNADLVVANDVTQKGAGFDVSTNIVTLIDKAGNISSLPKMTKEEVALAILEKLMQIMQ